MQVGLLGFGKRKEYLLFLNMNILVKFKMMEWITILNFLVNFYQYPRFFLI